MDCLRAIGEAKNQFHNASSLHRGSQGGAPAGDGGGAQKSPGRHHSTLGLEEHFQSDARISPDARSLHGAAMPGNRPGRRPGLARPQHRRPGRRAEPDRSAVPMSWSPVMQRAPDAIRLGRRFLTTFKFAENFC
jgi:hypothetical protein